MFNKIVEFLFCADIIKTPKVFCLTFGVHYMTYFLLSNKSYPIYYLFISASIASNSGQIVIDTSQSDHVVHFFRFSFMSFFIIRKSFFEQIFCHA